MAFAVVCGVPDVHADPCSEPERAGWEGVNLGISQAAAKAL